VGLDPTIVPATGLDSETTSRFLKGTFKARTSKSKIFSQFSVFRFGACAEISLSSKRKAIPLRAVMSVSATLRGLKPGLGYGFTGTTEVVPFPNEVAPFPDQVVVFSGEVAFLVVLQSG
jgi:hypothetical protein